MTRGVPVTAVGAVETGRLVAVIERQRRDMDRIRAECAARSVVDTAQGMLMERLGCPAAEAARQLARLAHESGTTLAAFAAEVTGQHVAGMTADPGEAALARGSLGMAGAAMQGAADGDGLAAAALAEALAPAGACAVCLWLCRPDGGLDLAGQAGLGMWEAARWQHIPAAMDCPAQRAVLGGTEILWPSGRPGGDTAPVAGGSPEVARAVIPLPGTGLIPGVLEVCWPGPVRGFSTPLLRQLRALAGLCAQALGVVPAQPGDHRASWLYGLLDAVTESAIVAVPLRDGGEGIADLLLCHVSRDFVDPAGRAPADLAGRPLLQLYPAAAGPGGLFDLAVEVLTTGQPRHQSGGILGVPGSGAGASPADIRVAPLFGGVVITWKLVDEAGRLASLLQHAERLGSIGGWEEDILRGGVRWTDYACALFGRQPGAPIPLADLPSHVLAEDVAEVTRFRDLVLGEGQAGATVFRIVRADDGSVRQMRGFAEPVTGPSGAVAAVRGAYQDVSASYHTQVALRATRDRLADTEERAEEEHRLALRLQKAITPSSPRPLAAAGLDVAARYRPAGAGHLVSGDWYDTVLLPTSRVLLVVGDIAGHGIGAVTGMVELRNCLRGLAITGAGPGRLLTWLNEVACELTDGTFGTALCGLYDPAQRTLRWARAGHLPPFLVRDGRARALPSGDTLLLGADPDVRYEEISTVLRPGDALLLFTDGLIERRGEPIDEGLAALARIASHPVGSISGYADRVMRLSSSDTGDDACLVAVSVR